MLSRWLITAIVSVGFAACSENDERVFSDDGNFEAKPTSLLKMGANGASLEEAQEEVKEAAKATYRLKITGASGAVICKGQIALTLMTNFNIKFPSAFVKCSSMTIDLASLLSGSLGAGGAGGEGALSGFGGKDGGNLPVSHDGKVLYFKEIANTTFDPPRPFLLGPIISDAKKYEDFELNVQSTANTNSGKSGKGSFKMKVHDHKMDYSNSYMEENGLDPFENTMHWELKTSGFDGFKAEDGIIIERFVWHWNTRPLMIPEIQVEGEIGDLMGSGDPNSADDKLANDFVGYVTINLKVEKYEVID